MADSTETRPHCSSAALVSLPASSAEEKIGVLEKTEEKIESQMDVLDGIKLDSNALRSAVSDFRADLEAEKEVTFIRWHYKISTGQKSRAEVEHEKHPSPPILSPQTLKNQIR